MGRSNLLLAIGLREVDTNQLEETDSSPRLVGQPVLARFKSPSTALGDI